MTRAPITTHILSLHNGTPAEGLKVCLKPPGNDTLSLSAVTDIDGRINQWSENFSLCTGTWTIQFFTDSWFQSRGQESFYSDISIAFKVNKNRTHYHVPLLLNAFGYSTYRGS